LRAAITGVRGDLAAALADIDTLLAAADAKGDRIERASALGALSYVQHAAGNDADARTAALQFLEIVREVKVEFVSPYSAALYELGFAEDVVALLESTPDAYDQAARRLGEGHLLEAADAFAAIPVARMEAEARLLAARELVAAGRRAEADAQLERALRFFRAARATSYLRKAEALLAATA
jgi:hypothetical protein